MHDAHPEQAETYRRLREAWFNASALAGYQPVEVPPVGFADTFTTGHNAAGDRTYQFTDRKGRQLALVSDSLPALLRLAHGRSLPEQRLSHCTQIFRYERRPRRCFHQLGILETAQGPATLTQQRWATARLALTLAGFLRDHLPAGFVVFDLGIWRHIVDRSFGSSLAVSALHRLQHAPACQWPAMLHAMGAGPDSVRVAEQLVLDRRDQGLITGDDVIDERIENCRSLAAHLRRHEVTAEIDLAELHAAEFHDGPAFLVQPEGQERLIGDGGSYGLFGRNFLNAPTAVYSTVVGLERLADLSGKVASAPPADIAVLIDPQEATIALADSICMNLRQHGVRVWDTLLTGPLRQHLRDIARLQIPYSTVIGAREVDADHLVVRVIDGAHHHVPPVLLPSWLRNERTPGGSQHPS